ncbi:MAG: hypothetical protein AAB263_20845 [Planctomycetota bacterium]
MKHSVCWLVVCIAFCAPFSVATETPAATTDPVLVMVNGEAIRESLLSSGIPKDMFGGSRNLARTNRLRRLIDQVSLRQMLSTRGVIVDPKDIEKAYTELIKAPPDFDSCPGCSQSYSSFEDYLQRSFLTYDDVRADLASNMAIDKLIESNWERAHPGPTGKTALIDAERAAFSAKYRRFWRIAIPIAFDEIRDDPKRRGPGWAKAVAVCERLRKGDDFAVVAKDINGDAYEGKNGGYAGIFPIECASSFGLDQTLLNALPANTASEPRPGYMGYQIVKWQPITDDDILEFAQKQFAEKNRAELFESIAKQRKLEWTNGKALVPK